MTDPPPPQLRIAEFAFPGELRDRLVAAILSGEKTATTGLLVDYQRDGEPLPHIGERFCVVDSSGVPVAVIEIEDVAVVDLADVNLATARAEGEGFLSIAEWRDAHEAFWNSYADEHLSDETHVVVERFRLA